MAHVDLCTGCGLCLLACSFKIRGEFNPRGALMRVELRPDGLLNVPVVCEQCVNPFCQRVCPSEAVYREGAVKIEASKCTGCGICVEYCPFGVIRMVDKKAFKCELCGGEPECIKACPMGALEMM